MNRRLVPLVAAATLAAVALAGCGSSSSTAAASSSSSTAAASGGGGSTSAASSSSSTAAASGGGGSTSAASSGGGSTSAASSGGGSSSAASSSTAGGPVGGDPSAPSTITASIDIWHYFQDSPQTKQLFAAWTAEFNAKYPNVKVNFVYVPYDQMNNKLLLSGQQGSGPDGALYDPSNAAALMSAKAIVDMAPYVNNWSDLSQIAKSAVWKSGDQVLSIQGYVNLLGFYYNKDVLTKAGVKPATTVAELQAQLPKLKAVGVNALDIPGKPTADGEFGAFPWFLGEGVNYTNLSSPVTTTVLARTAQWVKDGYVPKDAAVWGPTEAFADWIKGNAAYCQCGNWELGTAKTDAKFAYGVVAQPAGAAGSHVVGGGEGASIGSAAKNPALVAEFFKLTVLSKAGQLAFLTINGGLPTRLDAGKDPSVTSNALLAPFAGEVANTGSRPSSPKISRAMIAMGTAWSAALSGQQSPSGAAQTLASSVAQIMN